MKFVVLFFSFVLFGCGGSENSSSQDTIPQAQKNISYENPSNLGYPSEEALANAEKPMYGGPADFTVQVEGAQPGTTSDLIGFYAEQHFKADTATIGAGGVIRFQNQKGYPQGLYYVSFAPKRYLQIMLGEDQQFTIKTTRLNPDGAAVIDGSDENEALFKNIQFEKEGRPKFQEVEQKLKTVQEGTEAHNQLKAQQDALTAERDAHLQEMYTKYPNTLFTKFKKAGQNPVLRTGMPDQQIVYHYREDFWEDVDFSDKRLLRTPVINNKLKRYFEELTPQNQDSIYASATRLINRVLIYPDYFKFFANWVVLQYEPTKTSLMDPEFVFVNMAQNYFTRDRAFWADSLEVFAIQQRAGEMANSLINSQAPNVIAKDLDGKTHNLLESDADYIIVYMFAPSCEHCQEETPKMVQWYHQNKNKYNGIDVYGIALDSNQDDPNELANYIKKVNIPFPVVWDPTNRSIYKTYYVDITPEIYVLNKERVIVGKNLKTFQIQTIIDRDQKKRNG